MGKNKYIKKLNNKSSLVILLIIFTFIFSLSSSGASKFQDIEPGSYKELYLKNYGKNQIDKLLYDLNDQTNFCNEDVVLSEYTLNKYLTISTNKEPKSFSDVILAIDNSRSMLGSKMTNAKSASTELIDLIKSNDRIALFVFSNTSLKISDFTSNKEVLKKSIDSIKIGSSTYYGQSLQNIYYYIRNGSRKENSRSIILVSDGAPKDDENEIYDIVEKITKDKICLITIGYGDDLKSSNQGQNILQNIATISKKNTNCGSYLYSPTEISSFANMLKKAYQESKKQTTNSLIVYNIGKTNISSNEELKVYVKLRSSINGIKIPGEIIAPENENLCFPKMFVFLVLENKNNRDDKDIFSFTFNEKENEYELFLKNLTVGEYKSYIFAISDFSKINGLTKTTNWKESIKAISTIKNLDNGYIETNVINSFIKSENITINENRGENSCKSDCLKLQNYIFSKTSVKDISITSYGFIPNELTINDKTTIRWTNNDNKISSIIIKNNSKNLSGQIEAKTIEPNESYSMYIANAEDLTFYDNLSNNYGKLKKNKIKILSIDDFVLQYKDTINFAIIIDKSGSMFEGKLEEIKRSTENLFDKFYYDDKVAIITFSEDGELLQNFTKNITKLKKSIKDIKPAGSTLYIEGLNKAETIFKEIGSGTKKIIIFLTDGKPWDKNKPDSIYDKTKDLVNQGICIYTVGYGIPNNEREAHEILKEIVSISRKSTKCGNYSYVESDEKELKEVFGKIYYKEIGDIEALLLISNISSYVNKYNEKLSIQFEVRSKINYRKIPYFGNLDNTAICTFPAFSNYTIYKNGKKKLSGTIDFIGQGYDYFTEIDVSQLKNGDYTIIIDVRAVCDNDYKSNFIGKHQQKIIITGKSDENGYMIFLIAGIIILTTMLGSLIFIKNKYK